MCEMLRTLLEQSTDIHDEMLQQLKDIQERTNDTNEGHNALQLRVGGMERRLSDMQEQIEEGKRQRDNLAEEQTKFIEGQKKDKQDIKHLYKRQRNLSEEHTKLVKKVKGENKTHIPTEEGKIFLFDH